MFSFCVILGQQPNISDTPNFAKAFHERYGCSAREYRDALLENNLTSIAS